MSGHTGHRPPRVLLRRVAAEDGTEFTARARASLELHRPWISCPTTPGRFAAYVAGFDGVTAVGYVVCLRESGAIAGFVNVRQIHRESYRRGVLGYGAFAPYAGRGLMAEGLALAVRRGFGELGLHRLEADVEPGNAASLNLLKRLGFRREGFAAELIEIDGVWRDAERWAITTGMIGSSLPTFSDLDYE
ncbi:GNAT family N-acetyltransferase [Actinomadura yumaensis]|uniref:GNAT family N-acetyltransferase n=1 Tax=Actinomadura yumaensis TaxID=111807 RepID=A0ABW2CQU6_9ACTN